MMARQMQQMIVNGSLAVAGEIPIGMIGEVQHSRFRCRRINMHQ